MENIVWELLTKIVSLRFFFIKFENFLGHSWKFLSVDKSYSSEMSGGVLIKILGEFQQDIFLEKQSKKFLSEISNNILEKN